MPEEIEVKNGDGSTAFKCWDMDGLYLPLRCKDPVKRLKDINEMEYKDGDIHIVSYPKVGTHWIMDSLTMVLKGKAEVSRSDAIMFELFPSLDGYIQQESDRLAVSHLRPNHFSDAQRSKAKFILGVRNPKDAMVSLFYHLQKDVDFELKSSWDDFFQLYSSGKLPYNSFFDYYRDWQKFVESNPDQVLVIYYEDMHKNYQKELRRIAKFVGKDLSDDVIEQIAKKGNVKTVQAELMKDPKVVAFAKQMTKNGELPFYRKGEVGDWKNHFTVAQNELYDQIIEEGLKGSMLKAFDYVL